MKTPTIFRRFPLQLTLAEFLVIIGVLGIIIYCMTLFIPDGWQMGAITGGVVSPAQLFVIQEIDTVLKQYKTDTGTYPTTAQGLNALLSPPPGVVNWHGPYLKTSSVPLDPWQNPYQYAFPSTHGQSAGKYDCWSIGPDGRSDTADDIGNWAIDD